ncbi:Peptide/nickel transport system substrate-binding protein [Hyphomicrobiales bacterium]|nr:Peptide/nickel transport system substrate-binding protein [Hyphomicrobiales bacterium]CAH1676802.1 Peptide/nickel transport system substrate-binding protein [Hyphomicrobiales bacterium]
MIDVTRRQMLQASAGIAAGTLGLPAYAAAQGAAQPKKGGSVTVAMSAATETVDPHFSRSQVARNVLMHMCETLVTIDERGSAQLQLAEDLNVSPDFRTYTFRLRKNVPFHNGKAMTSEDAKRSLERYARVSPEKARLANVDRISTPDASTLVVELKSSMPSWLELIKSPASPMTIIPAEECDKEANQARPISTGPFSFVDWDGVTRLRGRRFADYAPNTAYKTRDGYGGYRQAYVDDIAFAVVSEASGRVAGLQSGQYDILDEVPIQAAARLEKDNRFKIYEQTKRSINVVPVNVQRAPTDKLLVRQAIQAAIGQEELMAIAAEGAFDLNPSFVYKDSEFYPSNADQLIYNLNDTARAKALLAEAGYRGEEIVILTSGDIPSLQEVAVVMAEQLKAAGMKIRLDVLDWPGANARRNDPTTHNLFSTAYAIQPLLGPFQYQRLVSGSSNWSFYKDDAAMEDAWVKLLAATTKQEQKAAWQTIETHINSQVQQLKIGDRNIKQATKSSIANFVPYDGIRLWDIWYT